MKFYRWLAQKLGKKYLNLLQYSEEDAAAEAGDLSIMTFVCPLDDIKGLSSAYLTTMFLVLAIEGVTNDVSTIINGKAESFSKRFNLPEDEIVLMGMFPRTCRRRLLELTSLPSTC